MFFFFHVLYRRENNNRNYILFTIVFLFFDWALSQIASIFLVSVHRRIKVKNFVPLCDDTHSCDFAQWRQKYREQLQVLTMTRIIASLFYRPSPSHRLSIPNRQHSVHVCKHTSHCEHLGVTLHFFSNLSDARVFPVVDQYEVAQQALRFLGSVQHLCVNHLVVRVEHGGHIRRHWLTELNLTVQGHGCAHERLSAGFDGQSDVSDVGLWGGGKQEQIFRISAHQWRHICQKLSS